MGSVGVIPVLKLILMLLIAQTPNFMRSVLMHGNEKGDIERPISGIFWRGQLRKILRNFFFLVEN